MEVGAKIANGADISNDADDAARDLALAGKAERQEIPRNPGNPRKPNEGFARIKTPAASRAGSAIYPESALRAKASLRRNSRGPQMPLTEFYLYPPKYLNLAAIATLIPLRGLTPVKQPLPA